MKSDNEKMSKHTPGPWRAWDAPKQEYLDTPISRTWTVSAKDGRDIAALVLDGDEANARLISAAPDLLKACKAAHEILQPCASKDCYEHGHPYCAFGLTKAAIAKAERQ